MAASAKAELWFGTRLRPTDECPRDIIEDLTLHFDVASREKFLAERGLALVNVPDRHLGDQWALAIRSSYREQRQGPSPKIESLPNPRALDIAAFVRVVLSMGWELAPNELGWYMGASYL